MDMELMKLAVMALGLAFNIAAYQYMKSSNKDKATKDQIKELKDDLDEKMEDQGDRITKLESRAEGSPTHADLGDMHEKINRLMTDVGHLSGEFIGVRNLLNTIHQHLLTGGKK